VQADLHALVPGEAHQRLGHLVRIVAGGKDPSAAFLGRRHPQIGQKGHQIGCEKTGKRVAQEKAGFRLFVRKRKVRQEIVELGVLVRLQRPLPVIRNLVPSRAVRSTRSVWRARPPLPGRRPSVRPPRHRPPPPVRQFHRSQSETQASCSCCK